MELLCSNCQQKLTIPDQYAGQLMQWITPLVNHFSCKKATGPYARQYQRKHTGEGINRGIRVEDVQAGPNHLVGQSDQATGGKTQHHGLAGDLARDQFGEVSLIASDLLDFLPHACNC